MENNNKNKDANAKDAEHQKNPPKPTTSNKESKSSTADDERFKGKEWIKVQSKNRPGNAYWFNKNTGESVWCSTPQNIEDQKLEKSPIKPTKLLRTPAQDRLKRLQRSLTLGLGFKPEQKASETNDRKDQDGKRLNSSTPVSARASTSAAQTPPGRMTRRRKAEEDSQKKTAAKVQKAETPKRPNGLSTEASPPSKSKGIVGKFKQASATKTAKHEELNKVAFKPGKNQEKRQLNGTTAQLVLKELKSEKQQQGDGSAGNKPSFFSGLVHTMNMVQENLFDLMKQQKENRHQAHSESDVNRFESLIMGNVRSSDATEEEPISPLANLNIPQYPRGSANARLTRFRELLAKGEDPDKQMVNKPSSESSNPQEQFNCEIYSHSPNRVSASCEDPEPMDWEADEDSVASTGTQTPPPSLSSANNESEYFTRVNRNLEFFAAKNSKRSDCKWLKNFCYFVLDTNVILEQLHFVNELMMMKLCGTEGTIIYLPYRLIQELDKLKWRGRTEKVKLLAQKAIKYIDDKTHCPNIQAQSAAEEMEILIKIDSPDDEFINCCLQIQKHVELVVLLTEDVNLRNKARCNNILVATKSDLISAPPVKLKI